MMFLRAFLPRLALAALVVFALPCAASNVVLEELTWPELRDAIAAGHTTAIVPVGGTEQNGPHMALGKHNVRVGLLAKRIAEALGNAIVAPVVAYVPEGTIDPPSAHMRYPGTISVPSSAFVAMLEGAGRSLAHAGFRDVVFIGDHGGYQSALKAVAAKLNRELSRGGFRAHAIDAYYTVTETDYAQALRRKGFADAEIGAHAGLGDTSLTLALAPALVRADRQRESASRDANGVRGDPSRASAELGAIGVDLVVDRTVRAIRSVVGR